MEEGYYTFVNAEGIVFVVGRDSKCQTTEDLVKSDAFKFKAQRGNSMIAVVERSVAKPYFDWQLVGGVPKWGHLPAWFFYKSNRKTVSKLMCYFDPQLKATVGGPGRAGHKRIAARS